ncbi:Hypothetical protein NocV09_07200040 [Nannochloropsis oceanica]
MASRRSPLAGTTTVQADNKKRLENLLKQPDNQVCADCPERGPRWASATMGTFICIKCSGIHRNLGVHISFVRSVNLDEWKTEHVEQMERWGNGRARAYFEAEVPSSYARPSDWSNVQQMTKWIRAKAAPTPVADLLDFTAPEPTPPPASIPASFPASSFQMEAPVATAAGPPPSLPPSLPVVEMTSSGKPKLSTDQLLSMFMNPAAPPQPQQQQPGMYGGQGFAQPGYPNHHYQQHRQHQQPHYQQYQQHQQHQQYDKHLSHHQHQRQQQQNPFEPPSSGGLGMMGGMGGGMAVSQQQQQQQQRQTHQDGFGLGVTSMMPPPSLHPSLPATYPPQQQPQQPVWSPQSQQGGGGGGMNGFPF